MNTKKVFAIILEDTKISNTHYYLTLIEYNHPRLPPPPPNPQKKHKKKGEKMHIITTSSIVKYLTPGKHVDHL